MRVTVHPGQWSRQPAYRRDYNRQRRDIKRANGVCIESGCKRDAGEFVRCRPCRIEAAAAHARRRRGGR